MNLAQNAKRAIAAGFAGIWIRSCEHDDAVRELANLCSQQGWTTWMWDPLNGLRRLRKATDGSPSWVVPEASMLPEGVVLDGAPVTAINVLRKTPPNEKTRGVLLMRNVHPYLAGPDGRVLMPPLMQAMQLAIEEGAASGWHVLVLAHDTARLPSELEKMLYVVDHEMPDADERWDVINRIDIAGSDGIDSVLPGRDTPDGQALLDATAGLTRIETGGAVSLALVTPKEQGKSPAAGVIGQDMLDKIWDLKRSMLNKTGLVEMLPADTGFEMLGGLNYLKEFCLRAFRSPNRSERVRPRGILLLGLPGTGKSAFARALGHEIGLPTVSLDVGNLMGSLVGQTEERTRRALKLIDAMAPCVLFVD